MQGFVGHGDIVNESGGWQTGLSGSFAGQIEYG
jgi:hypothetical protein